MRGQRWSSRDDGGDGAGAWGDGDSFKVGCIDCLNYGNGFKNGRGKV